MAHGLLSGHRLVRHTGQRIQKADVSRVSIYGYHRGIAEKPHPTFDILVLAADFPSLPPGR